MRFKRIYVEIMNSCNLHCSFCIKNKRPPQCMSAEQFKTTAIQLRPYSDYLYLHVLGEPLMHPELEKILNICAELRFQVNLTTNGTLLKERLPILKKVAALRQINVSLHSFSQQDGIDNNTYLKDCLEAGEQLLDHVYMSYRLWNKQGGSLDEATMALVSSINDRYHAEIAPQGIRGSDKYTLKQNMFLNFEEMFIWPSLDNPIQVDPARCLGWKSMCAILVNGDVVPCCLDGNGACVLGNLKDQPFSEIIEGEMGKKILEGWKQGKAVMPLCQRCSYRLRFGANK